MTKPKQRPAANRIARMLFLLGERYGHNNMDFHLYYWACNGNETDCDFQAMAELNANAGRYSLARVLRLMCFQSLTGRRRTEKLYLAMRENSEHEFAGKRPIPDKPHPNDLWTKIFQEASKEMGAVERPLGVVHITGSVTSEAISNCIEGNKNLYVPKFQLSTIYFPFLKKDP